MKHDQYLCNPFISTDMCLLLYQCAIQNAVFLGHFCGFYHYNAHWEIKNKFNPGLCKSMFSNATTTILADS